MNAIFATPGADLDVEEIQHRIRERTPADDRRLADTGPPLAELVVG